MLAFSDSIPTDLADRVRAAGGTLETLLSGINVVIASGIDDSTVAALGPTSIVADQEIQFVDSLTPATAEEVADGYLPEDVAQSHNNPNTATRFARQWNMRAISADVAWTARVRGSPSVTVGILDSGIDYTYPDLAGRVDLVRSTNFVTTHTDSLLKNALFPALQWYIDMNSHGTHVASIVASNGHIVAGVTQRVTLMAIKVLGFNGVGSTANVLTGIVYAVDNGADVINMSLGSEFSKSALPGFVSLLNRAINYAHANGVTVVVSAGNANHDLDHNGDLYAAYCDSPHVICVSATAPTTAASVTGPWTNVDARAAYSNFGRSAITVAAPGGTGGLTGNGGLIWGACSKQFVQFVNNQPTTPCFSPNPSLGAILGTAGTSSAAPHVAGLAALLVERYGKNPGAIGSAIKKSADDLGPKGTDPFYGKGRINVAHAVM